jgi:hypothetical protein
MIAFERIRDALEVNGCRPHDRGGYLLARCPSHEDREPSLAVYQNPGRIRVRCFAGCDDVVILAALGLGIADLFDEPRSGKTTPVAPQHRVKPPRADRKPWVRGVVIAEYRYTDEGGKTLYVKQRLAPRRFTQYMPTPDGGKQWTLNGTRRVLYRLPEVIAAIQRDDVIYLCEGEKDADAIVNAGAMATTWTEGAWSPGSHPKWRDEYTDALAGARVIIVADRDEPGWNTARDIAAASVRVVEAAHGKDAADHLDAGFGLSELLPVRSA